MLSVDVRWDIDKAMSGLRALPQNLADKAVLRALNKTAQQAKTRAAREIKEEYGIGTRVASRFISIQRASKSSMNAVIKAEGGPLPLIAFNATQTAQGVMVTVKGKRFLIPHAFIATMSSGHKGVYARGGYKGGFQGTGESFGNFKFGKNRLPISQLFTFSIPQGFSNKRVQEKVIARIREQFPKVLKQELNYASLKK